MDERRNFTRVLFRGEAEIRWEDKVVRGELNNLSLRGMLVSSPEPCSPGTPVGVQIQLTGSTSEVFIRLIGKVVRQQGTEIAVEFTGMDLDSFMLMKNVIVYNSDSEDKVIEEFNNYMRLRAQNDN